MTYSRLFDLFYSFLLLTLLYIYFNNFPLNVDSTWILHGAKQILSGTTLYSELPALNPPLIYVYSTIPVLFSKLLPFNEKVLYILLLILLTVVSLYLSLKILSQLYKTNTKLLRVYLYALGFILILSPIPSFGEREHLLIIFTTPYILSMIYRNKISLDKMTLIAISTFAIFGFNLKPHFFLLFLISELILIINQKNIKAILRIDFFIIALSGPFYLLFIYIFFYGYYSVGIPLAIEIYTISFNKSILDMLYNLDTLFLLFILLLWFIIRRKKFYYEELNFFGLICISLIIYLIQQKGWTYHRIPIFMINYIFLTHILLNLMKSSNFIKIVVSVIFIELILMIIYLNILSVPRYKVLEQLVQSLPKNTTIQTISMDVAMGQSLLREDQKWASRFGGLIMLNKLIKEPNNLKFKSYLFNSIIEDLNKYKPDYIIFCGKYTRFNYYEYFQQNQTLLYIYKNFYSKKIIDDYIILKKEQNF